MKDDALLEVLEQTAEKLSIKLDYDDIRKGDVVSYGDSFTLRGENHILIDKKLNTQEKADLLVEILAMFDTEDIHLPPDVRDMLVQERERLEKEAEKEETNKASDEADTTPPPPVPNKTEG